jgi:cytoskeleton protein RodZ
MVNLLVGQVTALEDDRYDRLAGPMFVRAYLRNIARVLELNEAHLLAAYEQIAPPVKVAAHVPGAVVDKPMRPIVLDTVSSARRHWGLAAAALIVAGLWGWQQSAHETGIAQSLTPDMISADGKPLPGGIEDVLARNAESRLLDSVELLPSVRPLASASSAPASGDARVAQQQLASADSRVVTAEGDQLSLRFSADCWVEIKDRNNRVLVAALKHADDRLQLEGKGPFRVLLGFAPGVEMAYNGTPVNIEVSQGSRSARLIVGSS